MIPTAPSGRRIALIGNMNNNNFALLRYLRDLGADAHLFLYSNEHAHFRPECDTDRWDYWRDYVHELGISNGGPDALFGPIETAKAALEGYDCFLGNGISPILFRRMGKTLDVFVPYCEGVEFISEFDVKWRRPHSTIFRWIRKRMMERALTSSVRVIVTANRHHSATATYRRLGLSTYSMPIITKYDADVARPEQLSAVGLAAIARMKKASVAVFSQTQHRWKTHLDGAYPDGGKRNDWLIRGFAEYVRRSGDRNAVLCLMEYGPDVAESKKLVAALDAGDQIHWLPRMDRLEIMAIASASDLGCDAFMGMLWGGTGWELISLGKPLLHWMDHPESYDWPGMTLPFFYNCSSPEAITEVLLGHDRAALRELGKEVKSWHERFQGAALAKRYLRLLETGNAGLPDAH